MSKTMSWMMVALAALGLCGGMALAGNTNSPAGPTDPASAMWTLDDIYNKLNTWTNITKRGGATAFVEPSNGPTGTMHTLDEIMALVTNSNHALVPKTGQTNTWAVGDDKWYSTKNIGVAWPNPRFSPVAETGEATNQIRDNLTGLIWARNANLGSNSFVSGIGTCSWDNAFNLITNSAGPVNGANGGAGYGGANDWRLPNIRELFSLATFQSQYPAISDETGTNKWTEGHPFTGIINGNYWSSTAYTGIFVGDNNNRYRMSMQDASVGIVIKTGGFYVWPVRGP